MFQFQEYFYRLQQTQQQTLIQMYKYRDNYAYTKKDNLKQDKQSIYNSSMNYFSTIQSKYSQDKLNYPHNTQKNMLTQMTQSSRIAEEAQSPQNDYHSFQASILQKVECIQEESNKLLQKKERQLYFLKIQLKSYEERLREADEELIRKDKQLSRLEYQIQRLKSGAHKNEFSFKSQELNEIEKENEKLKESLRILIQQKNFHWKNYSSSNENSKINVAKMKQQIEELRYMVLQMEQNIKNCPKCFTLNREKDELSSAYDCLFKQHSQLNAQKQNKEKQFIENIANKIKENQNILRQNILLKEEKQGRPYMKFKGQRIKDSVAKRCRTLTDQF